MVVGLFEGALKKQRCKLEVSKTQPQSSHTISLLAATGQIWAAAQIPGKGKLTLPLDGSVTSSHCRGARGLGGIMTSFENTMCSEGNFRNHSQFHSEGMKLG